MASACVEQVEVLAPSGVAGMDVGAPIDGGPDAGGAPPSAIGAEGLGLGRAHSLALRGGRVFGWGAGGLGLFTQTARTSTPTRPRGIFPDRTPVDALASGEDFACILDEEGEVSCWGHNESGQLGVSDVEASAQPVVVPLPRPAVHLTLGFDHACALLDDFELWCWGRNTEGQLGRDDAFGGPSAEPTPEPIAEPGPWAFASATDGHGCAIHFDGTLWCWGRNTNGELGRGSSAPMQIRRPVQVGTSAGWRDVSCGQFHTCGVTEDDRLWCWGRNTSGQLGLGDIAPRDEPALVGSSYSGVATSAFASCAVTLEGAVECWGRNLEGQLGFEGAQQVEVPTTTDVDGVLVLELGRFHACVAVEDPQPPTMSNVLCTGEGTLGRLGTGTPVRPFAFVPTASFGSEP
ncbi:MAG: RCC1 domain-containing protein [Myxococcota bacterium]